MLDQTFQATNAVSRAQPIHAEKIAKVAHNALPASIRLFRLVIPRTVNSFSESKTSTGTKKKRTCPITQFTQFQTRVMARWNFDQQFPDTVQAKETQETKPTQQTLQRQSATTQSRWTFQSAKDPGRQRRLWLETEKGLIANPVDPFRMTLTLGRRPAHEWRWHQSPDLI